MKRLEFVQFAIQPQANIRELCRRFRISPSTAYKWIERHRLQGCPGLEDRSRKPGNSPRKTSPAMEQLVIRTHKRFPCWGPRKLRQLLLNEGKRALPAPSTFSVILKRHHCKVAHDAAPHRPFIRFSKDSPNELWQMDFKGDFLTAAGSRCYPLTLLDDHSRYALALKACPATNRSHVQPLLEQAFERYGLPDRILCDNAGPWGTSETRARFTTLGVWLLRLGVDITHGRPWHPQTQGKCERFHRTFKVEVLNRSTPFRNLSHCQFHFDQWLHCYNHQRPHQALQMATPSSLYRPSPRSMPSKLPPLEYLHDDTVRIVKAKGEITFKNHFFFVGSAFCGLPVALRQCSTADGLFDLFFSWKKLGSINLKLPLKNKFRYNPILPTS